MSAVWRAARAAVRRRRLQTGVIGLVVLVSTLTIVVALGLLDAASAPFDRAFDRQHGAQLAAAFDAAKVTGAQLAGTAHGPGVEAAAGPFQQAVADLSQGVMMHNPGPVTVVGRVDAGGPVDRVNLWVGHWPTGPGQIVFSSPQGSLDIGPRAPLGQQITLGSGLRLTVVGFASSVSQTADAWVSPDQIAAFHPTAFQMLYRFSRAGSDSEVRADLASVTAGLPPGSLTAYQSYLTLKSQVEHNPNAFVPFLMVFGILGLLVAVLIVGNVVSGAVVAGFRHIGVLKSLGFTPNQVVSVYLVMVAVPALVGCLLGTVLGDLVEQPLLRQIFNGIAGADLTDSIGLSAWVNLVALLGVPALVLLAALLPALRARRLSPARAMSAGSAQQTGRALRIQRRLSGTSLPRSVSLGLGLPFARPARTALTMAAVVLGVTTVTFATGLATTVSAFGAAVEGGGAYQAVVQANQAGLPGRVAPRHSDPEIQSLLGSLPGGTQVTAIGYNDVRIGGTTHNVTLISYRGTSDNLGVPVVKGRWFRGPAEIVASPGFLQQHGLAVGDRLTLETGEREEPATVVGETMSGPADFVHTDWSTVTALLSGVADRQYEVKLAPGANTDAYLAAVRAADPGLGAVAKTDMNAGAVTAISSAVTLTVLLGTVSALGVFNTVVLNTRERRRDLGMLKSIGMTPRQVTVMMVTSMAALGLVGGLVGVPLGILMERVILPFTERRGGIAFTSAMTDVWHVGNLSLLLLSGVLLAALGALVPSRAAARLTIAQVLHNE